MSLVKAYRRQAILVFRFIPFCLSDCVQHHPDKNPHPPESPEAEAVTRRFQEVYAVCAAQG
jgi:hypothetical protein